MLENDNWYQLSPKKNLAVLIKIEKVKAFCVPGWQVIDPPGLCVKLLT